MGFAAPPLLTLLLTLRLNYEGVLCSLQREYGLRRTASADFTTDFTTELRCVLWWELQAQSSSALREYEVDCAAEISTLLHIYAALLLQYYTYYFTAHTRCFTATFLYILLYCTYTLLYCYVTTHTHMHTHTHTYTHTHTWLSARESMSLLLRHCALLYSARCSTAALLLLYYTYTHLAFRAREYEVDSAAEVAFGGLRRQYV